MRFVDEFRDADKAHALAAQIAAPVRAGPPVQAHGGVRRPYPHDLQARHRGLPAARQSTLVHGPGCPVCVIPMGRVDDAIAHRRGSPT